MVTNEEVQLTPAQDSVWWCWGASLDERRPYLGIQARGGTGRWNGSRNCAEDEPQLSRFDIGGYGWLVRTQIRRRMTVFLGAGPANLLCVWRSLLQC